MKFSSLFLYIFLFDRACWYIDYKHFNSHFISKIEFNFFISYVVKIKIFYFSEFLTNFFYIFEIVLSTGTRGRIERNNILSNQILNRDWWIGWEFFDWKTFSFFRSFLNWTEQSEKKKKLEKRKTFFFLFCRPKKCFSAVFCWSSHIADCNYSHKYKLKFSFIQHNFHERIFILYWKNFIFQQRFSTTLTKFSRENSHWRFSEIFTQFSQVKWNVWNKMENGTDFSNTF